MKSIITKVLLLALVIIFTINPVGIQASHSHDEEEGPPCECRHMYINGAWFGWYESGFDAYYTDCTGFMSSNGTCDTCANIHYSMPPYTGKCCGY